MTPTDSPAPTQTLRARTDPQRVGRSATGGNPYLNATSSYQHYRPTYPPRAIAALLNAPACSTPLAASRRDFSPLDILEIGAGSGKFTVSLLQAAKGINRPWNQPPYVGEHRPRQIRLQASEPAESMRAQFRALLPDLELSEASAENLTCYYPVHAYDLIVYAQCWHWVNPQQACEQAKQLLRADGKIAIIYNQLDVTYPWVKRLTRVGRTGDVQFAHKPPRLGPGFTPAQLALHHWGQPSTLEQIVELVKTRSAYLKASVEGKAHLLEGVKHYLHTELGLGADPQRTLTLPYQTQVWTSRPVG